MTRRRTRKKNPVIDPILPYDLPPLVKARLLGLAARSDLLLLGEMHGTQEVPRLVLGLLDGLTALGYGGLGLELPKGQAERLTAWAAGEGKPPALFGPDGYRDGRDGEQTLALARQVSSHPDWGLLCFDVDSLREGETGTDRDRHMAGNLVEQWQERGGGRKVIAVCGNYHSRLMAPAEPDFGPWLSFGASVQQMRPDLVVSSVDIVFHGGGFFNGELKPFFPGKSPLLGDAEIRPGGWLGHTVELHLPHATPVTFLQDA